MTTLDGTLPVRPFHPNRFFGTVQVDGQHPRVAALAWDEPTPHKRSFLGQLYAMRVMFLHRDHEHPAWADVWAEELWSHGLSRQLLRPLKALGMKAWLLSGDLVAWSQLIKDGVRSGWLPWRDSSTAM